MTKPYYVLKSVKPVQPGKWYVYSSFFLGCDSRIAMADRFAEFEWARNRVNWYKAHRPGDPEWRVVGVGGTR